MIPRPALLFDRRLWYSKPIKHRTDNREEKTKWKRSIQKMHLQQSDRIPRLS